MDVFFVIDDLTEKDWANYKAYYKLCKNMNIEDHVNYENML